MNKVEKKLTAAVMNGNTVSPLLLDKIKERVAARPVEDRLVKKAKTKRTLKFMLKASLSSVAVFVVCIVTALVIPLFMPAQASPPNTDADGHVPGDGGGQGFYVSVNDLTTIKTEIESVEDYSKENSLTLLWTDGECEFYKLLYNGKTVGYKTVYNFDAGKVTFIQSTGNIVLEECEHLLNKGDLYATLTSDAGNDFTLNFLVYRVEDGFAATSVLANGDCVYVTINCEDYNTAKDVLTQAAENYDELLSE